MASAEYSCVLRILLKAPSPAVATLFNSLVLCISVSARTYKELRIASSVTAGPALVLRMISKKVGGSCRVRSGVLEHYQMAWLSVVMCWLAPMWSVDAKEEPETRAYQRNTYREVEAPNPRLTPPIYWSSKVTHTGYSLLCAHVQSPGLGGGHALARMVGHGACDRETLTNEYGSASRANRPNVDFIVVIVDRMWKPRTTSPALVAPPFTGAIQRIQT
ncbi:hypothetical protein BD779DRAFT_1470268 [Infundibulicybe gibba]|nr:hypothetical protein BD779DRAFT_1470268 [Infundibulicybe gibba]